MLKFISLRFLATEFLKVLMRFPVTIICAFCIAITGNFLIWNANDYNNLLVGKIIISCYIGACFSLAVYIFFETKASGKTNNILKHFISILIPLVYFFSLYDKADIWNEQLVQKNFVLLLTGHLTVAFAAYLRKDFMSSFWEFNKTLFLRFITSGIFTVVIYAGLSGAILACQELFGIDIDGKTYFTLFVWCSTFFQTSIFLAGVTSKESLFAETIIYSNPIKIFAQYILLPLALLYLGILYAYEIKILITFNLPKGWVSSLVLAYAIVGLFCFLLLNPIKDKDENKWVKSTLKYFYFSIIPLLFLLVISVYVRIKEYGITEERYYLIGLTLWLAAITAYGIVSKKLNIKLIPISLACVHLLMVIGPLNGFTISRISQKNRLEKLMLETGLWDGNKLINSKKKIEPKTADDIRSIVRYLTKTHNLNDISPLLGIDLLAIEKQCESDSNYNIRWGKDRIADSVFILINLPTETEKYDNTTINIGEENIFETNGAKFMVKRSDYPSGKEVIHNINDEVIRSYHTEKLDTLWVMYQNKKYLANMGDLKRSLIALKMKHQASSTIKVKSMNIPIVNADDKITIALQSIELTKKDSIYGLNNIEYLILIK